jgi:hypothetical protein
MFSSWNCGQGADIGWQHERTKVTVLTAPRRPPAYAHARVIQQRTLSRGGMRQG